jgi:D-serine deaminase-like pyridoxal phosphate-dependent protein
MQKEKSWYIADNANEYDSPALFIYPERVKMNIRRLLESVPPERLRPHVKTNKIAEVCQIMLDAGIHKFKSATIAEAESAGHDPAPDAARLSTNRSENKRLVQLVEKYPSTKFSCLVDHITSARNLSTEFSAAGLKIDVYFDLNRMNRTGIAPAKALDLIQQVIPLPSLNIVGLHAYDGHLKDTDINIRKENASGLLSPF